MQYAILAEETPVGRPYIVRICENKEQAMNLLKSIFIDAKRNYQGKLRRWSNPIWLGTTEEMLRIEWEQTFVYSIRGVSIYWIEPIKESVYSKHEWVLE